jgi:hypothetical protein
MLFSTDIERPNLAKPRTEKLLPMLTASTTDKEDPNRAKERNDRLLAKFTKWKTEQLPPLPPPKLELVPFTDKVLPIREKDLMEIDEPKLQKPKTDNEDPI